MFNPLVWLDSVLLGAAQKFCDKFQRLTGFTKFKLEKWAMILEILFFWMIVVFFPDRSYAVLFTLFGLPYSFIIVASIRKNEKEETEFLAYNELKYHPTHISGVRQVYLLLNVVYGIPSVMMFGPNWSFISYIISFSCWMYFSACVPKPPSRCKMREWYEKGLWWLNDRLNPTPALVPVPIGNH